MHQNPLARFQEKIEGTSINLHNEMSTCVTVLDWELLAVTVVISRRRDRGRRRRFFHIPDERNKQNNNNKNKSLNFGC